AGNPIEPTNLPALEVNLISFDGTNYISSRSYFDQNNARRATDGFSAPTLCNTVAPQNTSNSLSSSADRNFLCKVTIPISNTPIMIRARILYSDLKQSIGVGPSSTCAQRCSLPQQAAI